MKKRRHKKPLNEQVRSLREEAGLTQRQLGELCGWDQHVQSDLETGKRPLIRRLERLAKALKVRLLYDPDTQTWSLEGKNDD